MGQCCIPIFDVTIHAFDTSSVVRLRSSPNLTPERILVLPFPLTLTTLTLNQRSSQRFDNYFWKSLPEGPPRSFLQLRAKPSYSHGTPAPRMRVRTGRLPSRNKINCVLAINPKAGCDILPPLMSSMRKASSAPL